jgi:hypothetical protein
VSESGFFLVARKPQEDSRLPYLLRLPVAGGLILKARRELACDSACLLPPLRAAMAGER